MKLKTKVIINIFIICSIFLLTTITPLALEQNERLWVGDSRTAGLSLSVNDTQEDIYLTKSGEGYRWFSNTAYDDIRNKLNNNSKMKVIINLGINDCANYLAGGNIYVDNYIEDINTLIEEYPSAKFYYLSVNPVNGNYPSSYIDCGYLDKDLLNDAIDDFNNEVKNKCNATYIDSNNYLNNEGFDTQDGIHYTIDTYQNIYDYTINKLDNKKYISKIVKLNLFNISSSHIYLKYINLNNF